MNKKELFLKAYENNALNISKACRAAGIERSNFYYWIKTDPKFKQLVSDKKEQLIDLAESKLIQKIHDGNLDACIFFLKTKGKSRGYYSAIQQKTTLKKAEIHFSFND